MGYNPFVRAVSKSYGAWMVLSDMKCPRVLKIYDIGSNLRLTSWSLVGGSNVLKQYWLLQISTLHHVKWSIHLGSRALVIDFARLIYKHTKGAAPTRPLSASPIITRFVCPHAGKPWKTRKSTGWLCTTTYLAYVKSHYCICGNVAVDNYLLDMRKLLKHLLYWSDMTTGHWPVSIVQTMNLTLWNA